jgi:hypothetical protein
MYRQLKGSSDVQMVLHFEGYQRKWDLYINVYNDPDKINKIIRPSTNLSPEEFVRKSADNEVWDVNEEYAYGLDRISVKKRNGVTCGNILTIRK